MKELLLLCIAIVILVGTICLIARLFGHQKSLNEQLTLIILGWSVMDYKHHVQVGILPAIAVAFLNLKVIRFINSAFNRVMDQLLDH